MRFNRWDWGVSLFHANSSFLWPVFLVVIVSMIIVCDVLTKIHLSGTTEQQVSSEEGRDIMGYASKACQFSSSLGLSYSTQTSTIPACTPEKKPRRHHRNR